MEASRNACVNANADAPETTKQQRQAHKEEQKRLRKLERELRRKNKALAETVALLTLSKKAEAIWGTTNDD